MIIKACFIFLVGSVLFIIFTYPYHKKFQNKMKEVLSYPEVSKIKSSKVIKKNIDNKEMTIEKKIIKSIYVNEEMGYTIAYPQNYSGKIKDGLIFLHGLGDISSDWFDEGLVLENYIELLEKKEIRPMMLIFPESGYNGKSWYSNFYKNKAARYEDYFINELYKEIKGQWQITNFSIAGYSMGGYGALKLALKNLDKFYVIGSFSGATNLVRMALDRSCLWFFKFLYMPKFLFKSKEAGDFLDIFSSWGWKMLKENPYTLMKKVPENFRKNRYFYLSVGEDDHDNYKMLQQWIDTVFHMKKLGYNFKGNLCLGEGHTWDYVAEDMKNFLIYMEEKLGE